jgi:hypothetical protein
MICASASRRTKKIEAWFDFPRGQVSLPGTVMRKLTRLLKYSELNSTRGISFGRSHFARLENEKKFPSVCRFWRKSHRLGRIRNQWRLRKSQRLGTFDFQETNMDFVNTPEAVAQ